MELNDRPIRDPNRKDFVEETTIPPEGRPGAAPPPKGPKLLGGPRGQERINPDLLATTLFPELHPNQAIGDFQLIEAIGGGGMGEVWKARDARPPHPARALKFLPRELRNDPDGRDQLIKEAAAVVGLRHTHIVSLHETRMDQDTGLHFLVFDYVPGYEAEPGVVCGNLKQYLYCRKRLPEEEVRELLPPILDALQHAHSKDVIHRDIKPHNILLDEAKQPHLTDFGIARVIRASQSRTSQLRPSAGTPSYMPPEAIRGRPTDARSDIYSLGMMTYELLTGAPPFAEGETEWRQQHDQVPRIAGVSSAMNALIQKAVAKKPEQRWQSCAEMKAFLEGKPASRWSRKKTLGVGGLAVLALLAVVCGTSFEAADGRRSSPSSASFTVQEASKNYTETAGEVNIEMVWIPGGTFTMGSPESEKGRGDDETQHSVTLDGFWMGKTEVTNAQYRRFKSDHSSKDYKGHSLDGGDQPVVYVSWDDANAFCEWLTSKSGHVYSLPTEAQWEYACRAGTTGARYWGDDDASMGRYANVGDRTVKQVWSDWPIAETTDGFAVTAPVAQLQPNAFGLYDMIGNVGEWCADWYGPYPSGTARNPTGPSSGESGVLRGGFWALFPELCRAAFRGRPDPESPELAFGFRVSQAPQE